MNKPYPSSYLKYTEKSFQVSDLEIVRMNPGILNFFVGRKTDMEKFTFVNEVKIYSKKKKYPTVQNKFNHCIYKLHQYSSTLKT